VDPYKSIVHLFKDALSNKTLETKHSLGCNGSRSHFLQTNKIKYAFLIFLLCRRFDYYYYYYYYYSNLKLFLIGDLLFVRWQHVLKASLMQKTCFPTDWNVLCFQFCGVSFHASMVYPWMRGRDFTRAFIIDTYLFKRFWNLFTTSYLFQKIFTYFMKILGLHEGLHNRHISFLNWIDLNMTCWIFQFSS